LFIFAFISFALGEREKHIVMTLMLGGIGGRRKGKEHGTGIRLRDRNYYV